MINVVNVENVENVVNMVNLMNWDSKVKVKAKGPNMCYIFEKHGIQGYRI